MSSMFSGYSSLNELNLSNFNTNNIINKNVLGLPDKSEKKIKNLYNRSFILKIKIKNIK